jgi:ribosomal protein L27
MHVIMIEAYLKEHRNTSSYKCTGKDSHGKRKGKKKADSQVTAS